MIILAGQGLSVTHIRGREYLDATSGGVWCVNVGSGRNSIADAAAAQMKKMDYFAGNLGTTPSIKLAGKLLDLKHLGLWEKDARSPPMKEKDPGIIETTTDYSLSQLPPSDDYLYFDMEYPVEDSDLRGEASF